MVAILKRSIGKSKNRPKRYRTAYVTRGKRYLTHPSKAVSNDGYDNINNDFILYVNCALENPETKRRYVVKDILGSGGFGQVAKCLVEGTEDLYVAVKVIENDPVCFHKASTEVSILTALKEQYDPNDEHHIVRIYDNFVYQKHFCMCFELLGKSLRGLGDLPLSTVAAYSRQLLKGLCLLKEAKIIHADLKPENVLRCSSARPTEIKIIDFGLSCMEDSITELYTQSRYYRAPEVFEGKKYDTAIDMWSFGCIVAELFLGEPLFHRYESFDVLRNIKTVLCSEEEEEGSLEAMIHDHPHGLNSTTNERELRLMLIDFLRCILQLDPEKRCTPAEALRHHFAQNC